MQTHGYGKASSRQNCERNTTENVTAGFDGPNGTGDLHKSRKIKLILQHEM